MNRTGWAAAVGSLYKTRAGHTITLTQYCLQFYTENGTITETIVGFGEPGKYYTFDGNGLCIAPWDSSEAKADFDLISAVQPAQITKRVECKNDLATQPKEGTVPATVVPRKDLP